jgi:hypothetical protein
MICPSIPLPALLPPLPARRCSPQRRAYHFLDQSFPGGRLHLLHYHLPYHSEKGKRGRAKRSRTEDGGEEQLPGAWWLQTRAAAAEEQRWLEELADTCAAEERRRQEHAAAAEERRRQEHAAAAEEQRRQKEAAAADTRAAEERRHEPPQSQHAMLSALMQILQQAGLPPVDMAVSAGSLPEGPLLGPTCSAALRSVVAQADADACPFPQAFLQRCIRGNASPDDVATHWWFLSIGAQGDAAAIRTWVAEELKRQR